MWVFHLFISTSSLRYPHCGIQFHSAFQASVALNSIEWQPDAYPMDFYSADSLGPWTPNFPEAKSVPDMSKVSANISIEYLGSRVRFEYSNERVEKEENLNSYAGKDQG